MGAVIAMLAAEGGTLALEEALGVSMAALETSAAIEGFAGVGEMMAASGMAGALEEAAMETLGTQAAQGMLSESLVGGGGIALATLNLSSGITGIMLSDFHGNGNRFPYLLKENQEGEIPAVLLSLTKSPIPGKKWGARRFVKKVGYKRKRRVKKRAQPPQEAEEVVEEERRYPLRRGPLFRRPRERQPYREEIENLLFVSAATSGVRKRRKARKPRCTRYYPNGNCQEKKGPKGPHSSKRRL
ncbi:VP2 [Rhynchobatus djiddensis polyomavirus 1]|uniref:VP2 n=1 Tax=Rhynchobatus djiddensis polyomavirus 1 TaxID=2170102 RepID=A0A0B5CMS5_9POLY|nr:VP2 [Rhynchobatus djiddensis polyomavirus 1]AJE25840.1 VP2 [Rhynchobatus djiddensis polyomavirus 1]